MRLTIIPADKYIAINNQSIIDIQQDFSWVPSNVHAVQWYNTYGEVEYQDGTPNQKIEELGIYEQAITTFNTEKVRLENEKNEIENSIDYWKHFRSKRSYLLSLSDWTQVFDAQLTEEKKESWRLYRQKLRDLPNNISDPKSLMLDENHPDWPSPPS